jgi:small subunit ribosomal protein S9
LAEALAPVTATGKRKTAVARIALNYGTGQVQVNGKPMSDYFPREVLIMRINAAFEAANALEKFDVVARVRGGGPSGQADAVRHGIARALEKIEPNMRGPLKRKGFLTRDARKKERKKYGQKGARARFQFSKR